jgi:hypothetical protein
MLKLRGLEARGKAPHRIRQIKIVNWPDAIKRTATSLKNGYYSLSRTIWPGTGGTRRG